MNQHSGDRIGYKMYSQFPNHFSSTCMYIAAIHINMPYVSFQFSWAWLWSSIARLMCHHLFWASTRPFAAVLQSAISTERKKQKIISDLKTKQKCSWKVTVHQLQPHLRPGLCSMAGGSISRSGHIGYGQEGVVGDRPRYHDKDTL